MKAQLESLVYPGFVAATGYDRLVHVPRYLDGMSRRIEKMGERLSKDTTSMLEVQALEDDYDAAAEKYSVDGVVPPPLADVGWMIE